MPNLLQLSGAFIAFGVSQLALASDHFVVREHHIDVSDIDEFRIDAGVGILDVEPSEDDQLHIVVEIEGNRQGFFRRSKRDVTDIDVKTRVKGDTIFVELNDDDYDDLEVHWRIAMPQFKRTELDLSVGQINAQLEATTLEVDLGVGEANVTVPRRSTGKVKIDVGVGGAHLRGANDTERHRAIVSEEVSGFGDGEHDIEVDVGVGEASVVLASES